MIPDYILITFNNM